MTYIHVQSINVNTHYVQLGVTIIRWYIIMRAGKNLRNVVFEKR